MTTTGRIPWLLLRNTLVGLALIYAALYLYTKQPPNEVAAALCMTNAAALFVHSGRSRQKATP